MAETFPAAFGRYQLLRKLAQGGMAEIFLAQDDRGQICAIKRILPHLAHEESFIRMFIDEARIVSHLQHPNVAGVYDQGKERGFYYIAMEFVQGHSLLALSERAKATKMELPQGLLAFVVAELLAGLGCAHAARDAKGRHLGIVHRDVTPQNVLISYGGDVKLVDFGVAKARSRLTHTEAGFTKGKLAYMSPEQARGEELDGRSDLFSVGIILHEITTNARLFNKEGPGGILGAIVNDPIPLPSERRRGYPADLERVVMRALEKDVGRRYQTGEDMREDLLGYARRERPVPSKQRLSQLVHDLFGDPDSQAVIERARESAAPTPEPVAAHGGRKVEASAPYAEAAPSLGDPPARDETRMMNAGMVDLRERPKSRVVITQARAQVAPDPEPPVPEPVLPWRVRLGRFVADLGGDLQISWRVQRRRWIIGIAAMVVLAGAGGLLLTGAVGALGRWASAAAEAAREAKSSAGLVEAPGPDLGLRPTRLRVSTEPPGAAVVIGGIGMGVTPVILDELPIGRPLRLELSLLGYRAREEELVLAADRGLREEHFSLERQVGALELTSSPDGARVFIDGADTGQITPARLEGLAAGTTLRVEARARGRRPQSKAVVIPDGGSRALHFTLPVDRDQIPSGRIAIESTPSGCLVLVDGTSAGLTPIRGHLARPGPHVVEVRCEHHAPESRSVSVRPKDTTRVEVRPRPDTFGYLTIEPIPARGSSVEINGREVKTPVRFRKVVPGRHVVVVRNRGLNAEKQLTVNVGPDARVTRRVSLTF